MSPPPLLLYFLKFHSQWNSICLSCYWKSWSNNLKQFRKSPAYIHKQQCVHVCKYYWQLMSPVMRFILVWNSIFFFLTLFPQNRVGRKNNYFIFYQILKFRVGRVMGNIELNRVTLRKVPRRSSIPLLSYAVT